jgi:hypothetical protein
MTTNHVYALLSETDKLFEIGSSLREARVSRKLELSQIERETRIRAKYLRALEDERFEVLPGAAYTKGFLRTYADYLDLDAQRLVDEYNGRFAPEQELDAPAPVRIRRRFTLAPWMLALGVFAASTALLAWRLESRRRAHRRSAPRAARTQTTTAPATAGPPARPRTATVSRIVLVASRGPCWLSVHISSAAGQTVFERTLQPSQTARFTFKHRHLWMRIGAPWNPRRDLERKHRPAACRNRQRRGNARRAEHNHELTRSVRPSSITCSAARRTSSPRVRARDANRELRQSAWAVEGLIAQGCQTAPKSAPVSGVESAPPVRLRSGVPPVRRSRVATEPERRARRPCRVRVGVAFCPWA